MRNYKYSMNSNLNSSNDALSYRIEKYNVQDWVRNLVNFLVN